MTVQAIADSANTCEAFFAFTLGSRDEVDTMMAAAKSANAAWVREATEEEAGMYAGSFRDPFHHQIAIHAFEG